MNFKFIGAVLCATALVMSCKNDESTGYVGVSDIQVTDGVMSPEVLLSFGRLSDPQISPDGKKVLWLDVGDKLRGPDGKIRRELSCDGVHLNDAGYRIWLGAMLEMMKGK